MEPPEEIWRMAFSRRLGVIGIVGACWFVAVGCDDDGDQKDTSSDGGEGGEAPIAGKASAGSVNNAGKGGNGTAGNGGDGGGETAGTGATAGDGGNSGTAGQGGAGAEAGNGGAAGTPVIPVGGGGGAGGDETGGVGGEGGAPAAVAKRCANECEIDGDCAIGIDETLKCNQATKRCEDPLLACSSVDDCRPWANEWRTSCATSADCFAGFEACVDWQGKGYCAALNLDGCFPGEPTMLPEHGAVTPTNVEVCVAPSACKGGSCTLACDHAFSAGCADAGDGDTCSLVTHLCECEAGTECSSGICGGDSLCQQCVTAQDCPAGTDACVNGKCGCSAAAVCPDLTAAGTPVCE
jgi:hypothetical protein